MKCTKIYLLYAKGSRLTGIITMCEFTAKVFKLFGISFATVHLPALDRSSVHKSVGLRCVSFGLQILTCWIKSLRFLLVTKSVFVHAIGLGWVVLLRDVVPLVCGSIGKFRQNYIITTLHNNLFIQWPLDSLKLKFFRWYLHRSDKILVLGAQQSAHLVRMGIPGNKLTTLPNTCDMHVISAQALQAKHIPKHKVQCLFLSNLIDTKGYVEFVQACTLLNDTDVCFDALLCGSYLGSRFNTHMSNHAQVDAFVQNAIAYIKKSHTSSLTWVKSAQGVAKQALFGAADVFVFPSHMEAQPLVILEAMASGAAIITSKVGEIPDLVDDSSAILLDEITPQTVAQAMQRLIQDPQLRLSLAACALERYQQHFSFESFTQHWQKLLEHYGLVQA